MCTCNPIHTDDGITDIWVQGLNENVLIYNWVQKFMNFCWVRQWSQIGVYSCNNWVEACGWHQRQNIVISSWVSSAHSGVTIPYLPQVTDDQVVRAGISVTWNVLSWSGGHEFAPRLGRIWGVLYFCPKLYLNQK